MNEEFSQDDVVFDGLMHESARIKLPFKEATRKLLDPPSSFRMPVVKKVE